MVLGNLIKEWGLIQAIGLGTYPAGKFTPFFFNKLTTTNKEKKKKQKEKKIKYLQY